MAENGKIVLTDYRTVAELIKAFRVKVEKKGDDYSGWYYEVEIYEPRRISKTSRNKTTVSNLHLQR